MGLGEHRKQRYHRPATCIAGEPGHREPWPGRQCGWTDSSCLYHWQSQQKAAVQVSTVGLQQENAGRQQFSMTFSGACRHFAIPCRSRVVSWCCEYLQPVFQHEDSHQDHVWRWNMQPRACDTADMAGPPSPVYIGFSVFDKSHRRGFCVIDMAVMECRWYRAWEKRSHNRKSRRRDFPILRNYLIVNEQYCLLLTFIWICFSFKAFSVFSPVASKLSERCKKLVRFATGK